MLKINTRRRAYISHVPFLVGIISLTIIYFIIFHVPLLRFSFLKYKEIVLGLIFLVLGISVWRVYFSTYLDLVFFPSHLVVREYSLFKKNPSKPVNYLEIPSNCLVGYCLDEKKWQLCFTIRSSDKERTIKFFSAYLSGDEKKAIAIYLQNLLYNKNL